MQNSTFTLEQTETIKRYFQTGDVELLCCPWPGGLVSGGVAQGRALREAFVEEVRQRTKDKKLPDMPALDLIAYTRKKV